LRRMKNMKIIDELFSVCSCFSIDLRGMSWGKLDYQYR